MISLSIRAGAWKNVCLPVPAVWEQMLSKSMVSKSSLNKESLTVYCQWKGYKVAYPAANICSISFFLCLYKNYIKIAKYTLNKLKSLSREATQHDKRTKRCGVPRTLQCWGRDMYLRAQLQIGICFRPSQDVVVLLLPLSPPRRSQFPSRTIIAV